MSGGTESRALLVRRLKERFGADDVVLTDSGTTALSLAIGAAIRQGGTVALPAFSCPDLLTAAVAAGASVRLYDLDPSTLSPDLASVDAAFRRGVDAVVVAYLYGYPADVSGVATLAREHGVSMIEDAAQAAGGSLGGRPLGSFGPKTVLSFGRGKGLAAGGGGALLVRGEPRSARDGSNGQQRAGWVSLGLTAAQWLLARPSVYALPSALPMLRLGETVYKEPHEPAAMTRASIALAAEALERLDDETRHRQETAHRLIERAGMQDGTGVAPIGGAVAGYLRLAVRRSDRQPEPALGILRSYPATLADYPVSRRILQRDEVAPAGAQELRDHLFVMPTHHKLSGADVERLAQWLRAAP